ncbi:MAG: hypothetical protein ACW98Y_06475 [Candidatus Thorarchaeota archaeon]|jgi:hypothetical protein
MVYREHESFNPPEEGLRNGESVVWEKKAGITTSIWFCGGCLPLLSVFMVPLAFVFFGSSIGTGVLFFCSVGMLYFLSYYIRLRRTRYYLTTKRIIEVRGGDIHQELDLERFSGKSHDEFLKVNEDYRSGADTFYTVRIYDLDAEILIDMKGLVDDDVEIIQKIGTG